MFFPTSAKQFPQICIQDTFTVSTKRRFSPGNHLSSLLVFFANKGPAINKTSTSTLVHIEKTVPSIQSYISS